MIKSAKQKASRRLQSSQLGSNFDSKLLKILLVSVSVFFVTSCVSVVETANQEPPTSDPQVETAPDIEFPSVDLTASLLNELLLIELYYHRNMGHYSIDSLYEIAAETRDPRLAEAATLRSINFRRPYIAAKATELWVELAPENSGAWLSHSLIRIELEQYEDAKAGFAKVVELSNDGGDHAARQIARVLSRTLEPSRAYSIFANFAEGVGDNLAVREQLIKLAVAAKIDAAEIELLLKDVFEVAPDSQDAAAAKFQMLVESNKVDEAEQFVQRFLKSYPASDTLRGVYGFYLSSQGIYHEAIEQFEQLPGAEAHFQLGILYERANQLELAREQFLKYYELRHDDQRTLVYLANIDLALKRFDEASVWIQGITVESLIFDKVLLSAVLIAQRGDLERAESLLRSQQTENENEDIRIFLTLKKLYQDNGDLDQALEVLNEALEYYPGNSALLLARSYVASELNKVDLVERDVNFLLEIQPDSPEALNSLGYTLADQTDRLEEAFKLIQQALELRPHDSYILDSMGWVHYKLGDYELAVKFLKTALELRYDPVIAAHLGEVYWVTGNKREAQKIWDKAVELNPDSKFLIDTIQKFTN